MKKSFLFLLPAILFILCGSVVNPVKAGTGQPPVLQVLDGSLGQLSKDSFNIVSDTLFFNHTGDVRLSTSYAVRNNITFRINPYSLYTLQGPFTATVRLELTLTDSSGAVTTKDTSLTVHYNKDSVYTDQDSYIFSRAYRVKVKVLDRSTNVSWDVWKTLILENELQSFPVFTFTCTSDTVLSVTHATLDSNTTTDELPVSWAGVTGADQYDLEWTYIDSSALAGPAHLYGNPASPSAALIFDNNSSRVTITGTSYNIPIFYDGAGTLFFRVRPVQLQAGGGRTEGHWTSDQQVPGSFYFKGHQRNLNWQSTASYAEEGKRKVVLQYYDGSLRGRQTVTKDNTTNTTIVSESFYDYQGRPVIQVLPAPTFSNVIKYSQNFNLGLNGAYDKNDFDSLADPTLFCNSGANPMNSSSGASQYYSPANPDKDTGFHKYIPDAQGYPFTQVEYLQDNTGRISRQSGVGPNHKIGSGHETQYYYGTPDQHELDALFGTEVGDHSHYFKTMVQDANGQFSVSYTDMHGRTIATALAGAPIDVKLDTLDSYRSQSITETLSDPTSNVIQDLVMESKKGLLVDAPGIDTFRYKLNPASLQLPDCNNNAVCYDCLYDLEITITDDCNNQKLPNGKAFDTVFHNFSLGGRPDTTCGKAADSFAVTFTKYLVAGSYEITKRLSVSRYGENYYRDSVFMKRNTCRTNNSFLQEQKAIQASIMQCQPTCQSCKDSLGDWPTYYTRFITHAGIATNDSSYKAMILNAYQQAQADCRLLCDSVSEYDDIRKAMLLDLTPPSGQYANADNPDKYSIFRVDTNSAGETTDTAKYALSGNRYLDENGNLDSVYDEATGTIVRPPYLSPATFATKFKLPWAEILLQYHPEYKKFLEYQTLSPSSDWDKRFGAVDTYAEALQKGYLNPTQLSDGGYSRFNATGTADYDPLAGTLSGTYDYRGKLETAMKAFYTGHDVANNNNVTLTVWEMATAAIRCTDKSASCIALYNNHPDSAFNASVCGGDLDMAWRNFRQSYLDIKRKVINTKLIADNPAPANPSVDSLLAAGHQPHFTDAAEVTKALNIGQGIDTTAVKQQAQASIASYYDATCKAYASMWWQDLQRSCTMYDVTDSAVIVPRLIQVCKEGSDGNHPNGASSVAPSSTYQYKSFEDVIDQYNASKGITTPGCNAYGIIAPKPYDQQTIYSIKPLWTRPDSCECSVISSMYANYQSVSAHYISFSDYLSKSFQTTISQTDLNTLMSLCASNPATADCHYLSAPIQLPPVLQCGSGDICVGSTQFLSLDSAFRARYPGIVPVTNPSPTDSAQLAANTLYENYLNYKLGFTKSTAEYLAFLNQANGAGSDQGSTPNYDSATISCAGLDSLVHQYKLGYLQPVTGYAALDMRTFAGNITPAEGPKGVFDINGLLIGNTTSGTPAQINTSFATIWNSSSINQQVGTLSALSSGKFQLLLKPGQLIPKNGITGMRYYQFETPYDTLDAVITNLGSYIDFGDGQHIRVDSIYTSATTAIGSGHGSIAVNFSPFYYAAHIYGSTQNRTVTVYHTDINGIVGFDNYLDGHHAPYLPRLKNLRGYAPQDIRKLQFHSTQDSSLNTLDGFLNKDQLSGLTSVELSSGDGVIPFKNYNFGSFSRFNTLKTFAWINTIDTLPSINFVLPDLPVNFPRLKGFWLINQLYSDSLNFSLPNINTVVIQNINTATIDRIINQVAAGTTIDTGILNLDGTLPRSSASDAAVATLVAKKWGIMAPGDYINMDVYAQKTTVDSVYELYKFYPASSQFVDYINSKLGTSMTEQEVNQLYLEKCGKLPDYETPDSSTVTAPVETPICNKLSFIRSFNGNTGDSAMDMVQTADGGYLVAGRTNPVSANPDAFVAKTDKVGAVQWYKSYGSTGTDGFVKIRTTQDGGFIALGNTNSYSQLNGEPFVVKGLANGEVDWSRTLGAGTTNGEVAVDIIQTSDGGYALTANYNNLSNFVKWEVVRLSNTGGTLWQKQMGGAKTTSINASNNSGGIVEDQGALIFAGLFIGNSIPHGSTDPKYDGILMKINKTDGSVIWANSYNLDNRCNWFNDLHVTPSGYIINTVETTSFEADDLSPIQQMVVEVDKSGNITHANKIVSSTAFDPGLEPIYPTSDGGYIAVQNEFTAPTDIYINKVNSGGTIAWSNRISLSGDQYITRIIQNSDGTYTAAGYSGGKSLFIRLDSLGKTGCSDQTTSFSLQAATYTRYSLTVSDLNLANISISNTSRTIVANNIPFTESTLCYNSPCPRVVSDTLFLCGRTEPVFTPVSVNTITNCSDSTFFAVSKSTVLYTSYTDSLHGNFDSSYRAKCLQAYKYESFTVTHTQSEYHHTLYYYDQAGNLLKTVPPAGVHENYDSLWLDGVKAARAADQPLVPPHGLNTQYRYNTLNQVIAQQTPDAGQSHFWYDRLGRLAISQNARQKYHSTTEANRQYSYTLYDYIGRITEVGQLANATTSPMTDSISRNESNLTSWISGSAVKKEQITQTVYDLAYPGFDSVTMSFKPISQRNLRNRVSYTSFTTGSNPAQYNQGTFYTYDIEGNVDTLLQDFGNSTFDPTKNIMNMNGNRFKRMVYQYDLVSGKVNSVAYQPHQVDAFYHRYSYDAENRLILAETSPDSVYWDREARYEYYKHGPLARVVIGDKMVQGLDYAYTLQGWLKGVNSNSLRPLYDMGRDGDTTHQNRYVARDAYGFSLNYFAGDYSPIGIDNAALTPFPGSTAFQNNAYRPLYNGNISSMGVNIGALYKNDSSHWRQPMVYSYRYDQLNRITGMDAFYGLDQANNTYSSALTSTVDFKERVSYDANGNIQKYLRNNFGETGLPMDSLGYKYLTNTNKLARIQDSASDVIGAGYDLHTQPTNNYGYDSIGNLIKDSIEHIKGIQWNVYGKITEIDHDSTTSAKPTKNIYYYYDAAGNRIGKKVTRADSITASYTWYVRDASGNVMATYTASANPDSTLSLADLHIGEKHIYGSSRLGILTADYSTDAATDGLSIYHSPWDGTLLPAYTGKKQYELTNHLGNVLATISDKKIGVSLAADSSLIDHYEADVQTAQDYYPFGMVMPGRMLGGLSIPGGTFTGTTNINGYNLPVDLDLTTRSGAAPIQYVATRTIDLEEGFTSADNDDITAYLADTSYAGGGNGGSGADGVAGNSKYRYGFNGKENDNEVKGVADQIDYGMRVYDPRAGRFLSVDPLTAKYAYYSPYQFAGNKPIGARDLDGAEDYWSVAKGNMAVREYETELRKTDPEHANQRIYEANKHAFFFVGGMLTAGSPALLTTFTDGIAAHGIYKVTSGIVKKDNAQIKDGMESIGYVATGELSGVLIGKVFNGLVARGPELPYAPQAGIKLLTNEKSIVQGAQESVPSSTSESASPPTIPNSSRNSPGEVTGTGTTITGPWLRGTSRNAGLFPESIANQLRGQTFNSFDDFRGAFWKAVSNDATLTSQFTKSDISRMSQGYAPIASPNQWLGEVKSYILHHQQPIQHGGGVYDVDNLIINTPRYHKEVLSPIFHY